MKPTQLNAIIIIAHPFKLHLIFTKILFQSRNKCELSIFFFSRFSGAQECSFYIKLPNNWSEFEYRAITSSTNGDYLYTIITVSMPSVHS